MDLWYKDGDVVQFTENHKWAGCFGVIDKITHTEDDVKYLIGVPVPGQGMAYIFSLGSDNEFEYVGHAVLVME